MDVHIGEIEATITDTGGSTIDDALLQRIVRSVIAILDKRRRQDERAKHDRAIGPSDAGDVGRYG
jgi:hypothetical protein